jgi:biotin carboxylase
MSRRILILGGSRFQLPLIRCARERGLHVITCDYLPGNPGHALADEYHNVSTTDREAVLALARRIGIDAVASFSSDPAMPAVAYVADALGLPGPPPEAIVRLTDKGQFRRLMAGAGLRTPRHWVVDAATAEAVGDLAAGLPADVSRLVVKPVDSCGSRGVCVVAPDTRDLARALQGALAHSRAGRCIVEQYVDGLHLHGDGFLQDGRLVHHYLGDQGFVAGTQDTLPVSTLWPSRHDDAVLADAARQVEAIARAAGLLDGPLNIEARIDSMGRAWIIEIGPRNGGDYIPIIQQQLTGFDFVGSVLDGALGNLPAAPTTTCRGIGACYTLHADRDGTYAGLRVSDAIRDRLVLLEVIKREGEPVRRHADAGTSLGVALLQFDSLAERDRLTADLRSHLAPRVR